VSVPIITVENLGKKYRLDHQVQRRRYTALRDVIAERTKRLFRAPSWRSEGSLGGTEEFSALNDVSFEVNEGEVVGIIGRNGAGKSTLLKILSRITEPTTGRVRLRGRVASLLEVGTGFHPELTGRENIFLNGAILGMHRKEMKQKFQEIVAFAEVEKFLDTPVKRYSSGMYVRLAFAVAAHIEQEILIVDEVLAVGDAEFQKKCLGKIGEVAKGGRTVLFVSHNLNTVERLCGRVLHLDRGQLVGDYSEPRSGIQAYLRGNSQGAAFIWRNSGNEFTNPVFVPRSLEAVSESPSWSAGEAFSNAYATVVSISGLICTDDRALNIGIALYNDQGTPILWSFMKDVSEEHWPCCRMGNVAFKVLIPPRWLNEGDYKIELLAGLHCRGWSLDPGVFAPSISFSIQGGLSDSPLWHWKRPGELAPVIPWLCVPQAWQTIGEPTDPTSSHAPSHQESLIQ